MSIGEVKWTEGLTMRYVTINGWDICESKIDAGTEVANPDGILVEHFHDVADAIAFVEAQVKS
jgi:hypothetical protein